MTNSRTDGNGPAPTEQDVKKELVPDIIKAWLLFDESKGDEIQVADWVIHIRVSPKRLSDMILDGARQRDLNNVLTMQFGYSIKNIWFSYDSRQVVISIIILKADDWQNKYGYLVTEEESDRRKGI